VFSLEELAILIVLAGGLMLFAILAEAKKGGGHGRYMD